jgi:hypothetical protein
MRRRIGSLDAEPDDPITDPGSLRRERNQARQLAAEKIQQRAEDQEEDPETRCESRELHDGALARDVDLVRDLRILVGHALLTGMSAVP